MTRPAYFLRDIVPVRPKRPPAFSVSKNERFVLDLIRRNGAISRADIARQAELTPYSISRIVEQLDQRGLLRFGERVVNGPGKPSTLVHLEPEAAYSLGFYIMSDAISAVLMDFTGATVATGHRQLRAFEKDAIFSLLTSLYDDLTGSQSSVSSKVCGVGVAAGGYFTGERYQINPPAPLDAIAMFDIDKEVADRLQIPVWFEKSGAAAAVGESLNGVGLEQTTFAYLFHDMGFGGALIIENELFRGAFGNAGEFSGVLAPELLSTRPTLELLRLSLGDKGRHFDTIDEMLENFDVAWPGVDDWVATVKHPINRVISSISAVFDPPVIVVGGGRMPPSLAERLIAEMEFYDGPKRRGRHQPRPVLVVSKVKGDATAIGAASIPLKSTFFL
jgi:predicted NBD/HSP70 family sugar kinase